jgi:methyl-accepting chemotaxis protein
MHKAFTLRHRVVAAAVVAAVLAMTPVRAHATSKDIIELQTQVQQLLDMVQRLQSTLDTRFGVLQHLVEQTADTANQMTQTVNTLQQKINQQNDALSGKIDTASGQVQSLNDSVDEYPYRQARQVDPGYAESDAEYPERTPGRKPAGPGRNAGRHDGAR